MARVRCESASFYLTAIDSINYEFDFDLVHKKERKITPKTGARKYGLRLHLIVFELNISLTLITEIYRQDKITFLTRTQLQGTDLSLLTWLFTDLSQRISKLRAPAPYGNSIQYSNQLLPPSLGMSNYVANEKIKTKASTDSRSTFLPATQAPDTLQNRWLLTFLWYDLIVEYAVGLPSNWVWNAFLPFYERVEFAL